MADMVEVSLEDAIGNCLLELKNLTPGTDEYEKVTKDLERLYKLNIEEQKADYEYALESKKLEIDDKIRLIDTNLKKIELNNELIVNEKSNSIEKIKAGVTATGTVLSVVTTVYLALKTMKFEETGVVRSKAWPKIHLFKH